MKKLGVGCIGWWSFDEGPDCRTVALCDLNEAKLKAGKEKHPALAFYSDYREMLKHPDLDLVVISTPNFVHAEQAIACLEAGKHVFLEKPMGIDRAECDAIIRAWRKSGKNLGIDHEMRISGFSARIRRIIDSGEYGRLRRIEHLHRRGAWLEEGNGIWRTRPERSGGHFLMHPIHEIDIMRAFAGEIVEAQTIAGPNVLPHYRIPDNICCHLFFESGVTAVLLTTHTLSADCNDPQKWSSLGHEMTMTLTFEKASVQVDFIRARILVNRFEEFPVGSGGVKVVHDHVEDHSAGNFGQFCHDIGGMRRDFIRRCAIGEPPLQDPLDAWKSHMVCLAAEESALNGGQRMRIDYSL